MSVKPKRSKGRWKFGNPTLGTCLGGETEIMFFKATLSYSGDGLLEYELIERELPWYRLAHVLIQRGNRCGFLSARVRR